MLGARYLNSDSILRQQALSPLTCLSSLSKRFLSFLSISTSYPSLIDAISHSLKTFLLFDGHCFYLLVCFAFVSFERCCSNRVGFCCCFVRFCTLYDESSKLNKPFLDNQNLGNLEKNAARKWYELCSKPWLLL